MRHRAARHRSALHLWALTWRALAGLALVSLTAAAVGGCSGGTSSPPPAPEPGPEALVAAAWSTFEAGDYAGAITGFNAALLADPLLADAHAGRGWSLLRQRSYLEAAAALALAIELAPGHHGAQAGLAMVSAANGQLEIALSAASSVLLRDPGFVFAHDASVTAGRLRLLRAQLYYGLGRFAESADDLDLLSPAGAPHDAAPRALLAALAALGGAIGD